ncbi:MAG: TRAP transporter substrate-binding protein [Burkholderiaceae bacterium]
MSSKGFAAVSVVTLVMGMISPILPLGAPEVRGAGAAFAQTKPATPVEQALTFDIAGSFAATTPIVGPAQGQLVELINALAGPGLKARLHEPGELAPPAQYLGAVGTGSLDAAWTTPSDWASKDSAFWLYTAMPFGNGPREYLAWMKYGGGETLFKQLHSKYNVEALPCGISPAGGFGWFRDELTDEEPFTDLKIRPTGLAGSVLTLLGSAPQVVNPEELASAMELKALDAAMLQSPALDQTFGLEAHAKNLYFPAWHQPSTLNALLVARKKWESLSKQQRAAIQSACDTLMLRQLAEGEALQGKALNALAEKGIKPLRLPADILERLEKAWLETAEDLAGKSPEFKKAWESYSNFVKAQARYRDLSQN